MNRLKTILQYKNIPLITLLIILLITFFRVTIKQESIYEINTTNITGKLIESKIDGDKFTFVIKAKEKIKVTYYIKDKQELNKIENIKLGTTIDIKGILKIPIKNTIPNTFNYKEYLNNKNITYIMSADEIKILSNKINIFYKIKNKLSDYINTFKSRGYLQTFIIGNKNYLNEGSYEQYQKLGVSHIFAISGMHISILASLIFKLLGRISENKKYYIVITFLLFYSFITSYTASILRSIALYITLFINKRFDFNLSTIQSYYYAISMLLIINPYLIFDIGFLYSSVVSFSLIRYNYLIKGNYVMKCLKISLIAFLYSLPITINNNFEINILSVLNNLIFVPLITFIIYPLSLLTLFLPFIDNIYFYILNLVEIVSNKLFILNIVVTKLNLITIILYYIFIHIYLISYQKKYLMFSILLIIITKYSIYFDNNYYISYLDVGQGDSTVLRYKDECILIDTGGKVTYKKEEWAKNKEYYLTDNTIKMLKSYGISKINYLVITHGDYDHMGEAINLVENFKVEKVIFNCGEFNVLEKEVIEVLVKKKIPYYSCIKELNIDENKLYFLNTKDYGNENDNSSVIYTELNNYKFLFMGDAGVEVEEDLIEKYNLKDIDVLKVGHHGSKTSSGKEFINEVNPKYSIISVGKKNRYGHPNKEVLENLNQSIIYRTDQDGSVIFKTENKKSTIKTYEP